MAKPLKIFPYFVTTVQLILPSLLYLQSISFLYHQRNKTQRTPSVHSLYSLLYVHNHLLFLLRAPVSVHRRDLIWKWIRAVDVSQSSSSHWWVHKWPRKPIQINAYLIEDMANSPRRKEKNLIMLDHCSFCLSHPQMQGYTKQLKPCILQYHWEPFSARVGQVLMLITWLCR